MSSWKEAYAELEDAIHDLPLWVNIARSVHHGNQLDDQDHLEAMTLTLDRFTTRPSNCARLTSGYSKRSAKG
jgi:hypothetical protein